MIVFSFDQDRDRKPVLELYVAPSPSRIAAINELGERSPGPIKVRALVDTGASQSFIQSSVLRELDLDPLGIGSIQFHTLDTGAKPNQARLYAVQLFVAGVPAGLLAQNLEVVEVQDLSGLDVEMLLGRDVIDRCVLIYSGPERRLTLTFG